WPLLLDRRQLLTSELAPTPRRRWLLPRPTTGPDFTFSAVVALDCGPLTAMCRLRPALLPSPAISAWVAAAGSERLVSVTIGSSTADGWPVSSVTASSETFAVP